LTVASFFFGPGEAKAAETAKFYSVAFEMNLSRELYPFKGPASHFRAANRALDNAITSDEAFANIMTDLKIEVPKTHTGAVTPKKIPGWVWHHHSSEPGVMQLVPQAQHTTGSPFWKVLHPTGKGGMAVWGGGYRR
jgi:hypothetical protein